MVDQAQFDDVIQIRRDIHQFPEIGFDIERTSGIVVDQLSKIGLKVRTGIGKTGVVVDLDVPQATKRIAFRADMDALPIQEERLSSYQSKIPGKAHLCGHDAHTAILIGVAKFLHQQKAQLKTNIRFIFQPCEEHPPGGALGMIADGCLEGVSAIYGLHVWPWIETGFIGICPGPIMAQADAFDLVIQGRGGHAAAPHQNINPIVVGSQIITMLQNIVASFINPLDPAVLTVATFHSGSAFNVIPSEAKLSGTVRTYSRDVQKKIKQRMHEIVQSVSDAFGAQSTLTYIDGYPPTINHPKACEVVAAAGKRFLDTSQIIYPSEKAMFGEDFAYYLEKIPGCFIQLGCRNSDVSTAYPLHHPLFNLDEECMKVGMQLFIDLATHELE